MLFETSFIFRYLKQTLFLCYLPLVRNRRIIIIVFSQLHQQLSSMPIYSKLISYICPLSAFRAAILVYPFVLRSKRAYCNCSAI